MSLPPLTVVDRLAVPLMVAPTTPQGVSCGGTLQGVTHYAGVDKRAGYRMPNSTVSNSTAADARRIWEGVDCGLGRIPLMAASTMVASIGRGSIAVGRIPPLAHACPAVFK